MMRDVQQPRSAAASSAEITDKRPVIVPLGGFLGAGKTSLILASAEILADMGLRGAAILNDQGSDLVDTRWVQSEGVRADQVSGGCFCCLFSDLIGALERLEVHAPDVIFAEAVGSCTDISATTLQPLKLYHSDKFRVAPYTVLVDPGRASEMAANTADPDFAFLFQKQLQEADLICFSKSDLYLEFPAIPGRNACRLSAQTKDGVSAWLNEVLGGSFHAGSRILEIDYGHYARAEARLAWLNCSVSLEVEEPLSPAMLVGPILDDLDLELTRGGFQVAHVKITDSTPSGFIRASVVANGAEPNVSGNLDASPTCRHELLLNIRAAGDPETLQATVENEFAKLPAGNMQLKMMQCFRPAPPKPEHRMSEVVKGSF